MLHSLAASPETAPDALTLLHELQVHQVELDLQALELHESRADLEAALRRQIELHDALPVGCFTLDAGRVVQEMNATGAAMLGIDRTAADGLPFDTCLGTAGAGRLRAAIARLDTGSRQASCRLTLLSPGGPERTVLASIGRDPAAPRYLLSLAYTDDDEAHRPAG